MDFWPDPSPAQVDAVLRLLRAALVIAVAAIIVDFWSTRPSTLLTERERRELQRDQYRPEMRERLRRLQARFRRAS